MELRESMQAAGFDPPDFIPPGKMTRFSTNGKRSDLSGWVHLFPDEQGAVFGCWRSSVHKVWQAKRERPLSQSELADFKAKVRAAKQAAEQAREDAYREAAEQAKLEWNAAKPATAQHPYLMSKGALPNMARVDSAGCLLIPVYGRSGEIQSLQKIAPDGQKRFFSGGRMRHGHVWLGEPQSITPLLFAEGFTTSDSLHRATGLPVCVCFSAGNLRPVVELYRKGNYAQSRFVVCGDDDLNTAGNPGRTKATEAAKAVGAAVVFPPDGGDFNDLAQSDGLETVRQVINGVLGSQQNMPAAFPVPILSGTDARDGTNDTRPLSELGNALRLQDAYGSELRYVYDAKAWLHWNAGAWHWDVDGAAVRRLVAQLPERIYQEGGQHLSDSLYFAKWARTSQKARTIEAVVSLTQDLEAIRLPLALVDADIYLVGLNTGQTVLDLRAGKARPAKQADYVTKALNVQFLGQSAKARRWLAFLSQVFGDDPELIDWLQRWCGYLLSGSTREQIFVFCFGMGANGKSVFADILRFILGDYARAIAPETLTEAKRQAGGATPDIAELIGARLAMSSETEDGAALAESLVKSLVAGDTMTARKLYSAPIQFTPQFKLMMLGNHKPVIRGNDYGIWRRVRLIPFKRTFKPAERDPALSDKLKAEAADILAWMVDGCMEWQRRGLSDIPATIQQATGEYQEEQDYIGRWVSECCTLSPSSETSSTDIYSSYKQWCLDNGLRPASSISLGRRLGERGFNSRPSNGKRFWSGLSICQSTFSEGYRTASGR